MVVLIIFVTVAVSLLCFANQRIFNGLSLQPWLVAKKQQWYRIITHGFVHANWPHLLVNMLVFWSFGAAVMRWFSLQAQAGGMDANLRFILLYFGGLIAASIYDIIKWRDNPRFVSVGASGAVSAVVFASIFVAPLSKIYIMGVLPLPGILFGVLYIAYESWSSRNTADHINHHAHLFGSLYGFIFPMLTGTSFDIFLRGFGINI